MDINIALTLPRDSINTKVVIYLELGGTPLYGLYRYVRPQRVWFFSHFGHKKGIVFGHFGYV